MFPLFILFTVHRLAVQLFFLVPISYKNSEGEKFLEGNYSYVCLNISYFE